MLGAQGPDEAELALEVDVMRQLEMLDEAGRLDVVGMRQHEFLVLRGRDDLLAELLRAQRAIDQRHRHGLALGLAEDEAVAGGELRRRRGRALELVDHLAFRDVDPAERHGEAELLGEEFDRDGADPDFADEGMGAAEAALGRIGEPEQPAPRRRGRDSAGAGRARRERRAARG